MFKVDIRLSILRFRGLPVADLLPTAWMPTGGRGIPGRRPSQYVGKFAVFIKINISMARPTETIPASNAGRAPDLLAMGLFCVGVVFLSLWL